MAYYWMKKYQHENEEELWESVEGFNECVREKGVSLTVLRSCLLYTSDAADEL